MRFHFPSLVFGMMTAALIASLLGADHPFEGFPRFDLEATDNHVFVLDRETGRVWEKFLPTDAGQTDQDFALPKLR